MPSMLQYGPAYPVEDVFLLLMYIYLIVGLILVIKGADFLVNGASTIARRMNISEFVIGLTVVSFGTSLPELIIALISGSQGKTDLIISNIAGSNIANVLLVLGISAMIRALPAANSTVSREIPITLVASGLMVVLLNDWFVGDTATLALTRIDGIILLVFFSGFIIYTASVIKNQTSEEQEWVEGREIHNPTRSFLEIVAGIVALYFGGDMAVMWGAVPIAEFWGMSEAFIGFTVIAIGTSLPELATSAVAAYKKNVDIAVGNVVGSNIFNIFFVLGVSSVVSDIPFNSAHNIDIGIMALSTVVLFIFMFIGHPKRTIQRHEGALFFLSYLIYMGFLIKRG
jgi:cation:H+ antiporter